MVGQEIRIISDVQIYTEDITEASVPKWDIVYMVTSSDRILRGGEYYDVYEISYNYVPQAFKLEYRHASAKYIAISTQYNVRVNVYLN